LITRAEIESQKKEIEESCAERMNLLETCLTRKNNAELNEIKRKYESELEQAREALAAAQAEKQKVADESAFNGHLNLQDETTPNNQMECDAVTEKPECANSSIQTSFVKDSSDAVVQTDTATKTTVGIDVNLFFQFGYDANCRFYFTENILKANREILDELATLQANLKRSQQELTSISVKLETKIKESYDLKTELNHAIECEFFICIKILFV
jgi:hypothetical protein